MCGLVEFVGVVVPAREFGFPEGPLTGESSEVVFFRPDVRFGFGAFSTVTSGVGKCVEHLVFWVFFENLRGEKISGFLAEI